MDLQGGLLLCASLAVVICCNLIIDTVLNSLDRVFNRKEFLSVLARGGAVVVVTGGLCFLSTLCPNLVIITTENSTVDFHDAVNLILVGEIGDYGYRIITKLIKILQMLFPAPDGKAEQDPKQLSEEAKVNGERND